MNGYTAHLKPGRDPVLVKEAFSWGALLFGPLWLASHHAWIPAALTTAALVGAHALPGAAGTVIGLAVSLLLGLLGRDMLRWSLERRGYVMAHVLAARDHDAALARLLTYRPDIAAGMAGLLR